MSFLLLSFTGGSMITAVFTVMLFALPAAGFCTFGMRSHPGFAVTGCFSGWLLVGGIIQFNLLSRIPEIPEGIYNSFVFSGALFVAYCMSGICTLAAIFFAGGIIAERMSRT